MDLLRIAAEEEGKDDDSNLLSSQNASCLKRKETFASDGQEQSGIDKTGSRDPQVDSVMATEDVDIITSNKLASKDDQDSVKTIDTKVESDLSVLKMSSKENNEEITVSDTPMSSKIKSGENVESSPNKSENGKATNVPLLVDSSQNEKEKESPLSSSSKQDEKEITAGVTPVSSNIISDENEESRTKISTNGEATSISPTASSENEAYSGNALIDIESVEDTKNGMPKPEQLSEDVSKVETSKITIKPGIKKARSVNKASTKMCPENLELFRIPFKHGWRREVVNRNVTDVGKKVQCDIYYFTPNGKKKLRSMVEIDDWLKSNAGGPVQYKHFTFAKMAVFEPPLEILRDAGKPRTPSSQKATVEKKKLKTTPMPVRKPMNRIKLSSVLPKQSLASKNLDQPLKIGTSKLGTVKSQSLASSGGQVRGLLGKMLGKRTLKITPKMAGHTFFKKRRLSPEWKPWHEEEGKHVEVIYPKKPAHGQGQHKDNDDDELASVLGTPSKLISSIVNPEPPKEVPKFPQSSISTIPNSQILQVSPNLRVHIVSKDGLPFNGPTPEFISKLGLNPNNVRMVSVPSKGTPVLLPKGSFDQRVFVSRGQRFSKPVMVESQGAVHHASHSLMSVSQPQPPPPPPPLLASTCVPQALPLPVSDLLTPSIPPPPPLSFRPTLQNNAKQAGSVLRPSQNPPRLHMAPMASSGLPEPPPLKMPLARASLARRLQTGPLTPRLSTPVLLSNPQVPPSSSQANSELLQRLASQCQSRSLVSSSSLAQPLPFQPSVSSLPLIGMPPMSRSACTLSSSATSNGPDNIFLQERDGGQDGMDMVDTNSIEPENEMRPSATAEMGKNDVENSHKSKKDMGKGKLSEEDQYYLLPVSFGNPPASTVNSGVIDASSSSGSCQEVNVTIHFSKLDLYCPTQPGGSTDCALEEDENVFFKLPAAHFKGIDVWKPIVLKLNGHVIGVTPGFANVDGPNAKLKTSVTELKDWLAEQSLKMKVCSGQKRRIILSSIRSKFSYLRSFMLLQENYNIMMSIFKHLSVIDLIRACRVCKIWRRMAQQKCLWRKVNLRAMGRIKWLSAVNFFLNVDVRTLVMPQPLLSPGDGSEVIEAIMSNLSRMTQLKEIRFGAVPQQMIDKILDKMPSVRSLGAEFIFDAEPENTSNKPPINTAATEIAMADAVDMVMTGGFTISEVAKMVGVSESDLFHLSRGDQATTKTVDRNSVLLCCMRLCHMGFTVDHSVIEARIQDIMKRKSPNLRMSAHAQRLICQKIWDKNHLLFSPKLPYQPEDSLDCKMKAYKESLRTLYQEMEVMCSNSILACVIKEFTVLNAARNRLHRVTGLSLISPANVRLPVMLVSPSSVSCPEKLQGLIMISSKDGLLTSNLVTHYLRVVLDQIRTKPLIIFCDGHESLMSKELMDECLNRSVLLHCVPKELSELVFPGHYGGILHALSTKIDKDVDEKKFIDMASFHLWKDWFENWQAMCRAFKVTGIFPLDSQTNDNFENSLSADDDSQGDGSELNDGDRGSRSELVESSDEEDKVEKAGASTEIGLPAKKVESINTLMNGRHEAASDFNLHAVKDLNRIHQQVNKSVSDANRVSDGSGNGTSGPCCEEKEGSSEKQQKETSKSNSEIALMNSSSPRILPSDDSDSDTPDGGRPKRLVISMDEDEKENKKTEKSPPKKKRKIDSDSIAQTIDLVIAESRLYFEEASRKKAAILTQSSQDESKKKEEKAVCVNPPLKMKLSSKGITSFVGSSSEQGKANSYKLDSSNMQDGYTGVEVEQASEEEDDDEELAEDEEDEEEEEKEKEESDEGEGSEMEVDESEEKNNKDDDNDKVTELAHVTQEGGSADDNDSDPNIGVPPAAEEKERQDGVHSEKQRKKKKKKEKKRKKKRTERNDNESQEDVAQTESSSRKKKKKKKKKAKKRLEKEDEVSAETALAENANVDINEEEGATEKVNTENSMQFIRQISLADHDYDAKFDSDSGNELAEEEKSETLVTAEDGSQLVESVEQSVEMPKEDEEKEETSGSSSDSDSSSSSNDSSSDGENSSDSSSEEEGDSDNAASSNNSSGSKEGNESSDKSESEDEKGEGESNDEGSSESEVGEEEEAAKGKGTGADNEEDESEEESDDESGKEASSKTGSAGGAYSDEDDDENGDDDEDDDSKCQLCMAANPPHSKEVVINWVDCDKGCGRWFHVICIKRYQAKVVPKKFVCPSCRCKR